MFSFLNKSYPHTTNLKRGLFNNLVIGSFIGLFLVAFQPFGLNQWVTENKVLKLLGFGLVSFIIPTLVAVLMLIVIPEKVLEDKWKIWKEILLIVVDISLIAFGNLLYGVMFGIMSISLIGYVNILFFTCLLGVFPVTGGVIFKYNRLLKSNLAQAALVNEALHRHLQQAIAQPAEVVNVSPLQHNGHKESGKPLLTLIAENEKDKVELSPEQLLFIESADNYSNIVYIEEGKRKKQLIRGSLKRMESQISDATITRCHRTFIVNLTKIKSIEGNAAGYRLFFYDTDDIIPVSRNYGSSITEKLKGA